MQKTETYNSIAAQGAYSSWLSDFNLLIKARLTSIVVFSALIGYILASGANFEWLSLLALAIGGMLITGASNAINQVLEIDTDSLMDRTRNRPLPSGRMKTGTAILLAGVMGILGVALLWYMFNPVSALLGAIALLSYSFVYTPMKRISPIAVFIGAFPGAIPPMIGWVAATGYLGMGAWILFAIQFFWQFPHFWAIAWVAHEDYQKAGFNLLPSIKGRTKDSAIHIVLYSLVLIPVSLIPLFTGISGWIAFSVIFVSGLFMLYYAAKLYRSCQLSDAKKLMFASFFYLPIVLIIMVIDKI